MGVGRKHIECRIPNSRLRRQRVGSMDLHATDGDVQWAAFTGEYEGQKEESWTGRTSGRCRRLQGRIGCRTPGG